MFSLKMWFDKRVKNEVCLEIVQSSQTATKLLKGEVGTLKGGMIILTNKTPSNEVLLEMVQTDSNLLK